MMRTDNGKSSDRIPVVAVYDTDFGTFEYVPIEVARPYDSVFYLEQKVVEAESANAISRFVRRMQQGTGVVLDINSAIREQLAMVPAADQMVIKEDLASQGFLVG
jgi:hypothetical protein